MQLTPEEWRNVISVGQFVATSAIAFYVWLANRDAVRRKEIGSLQRTWDQRADDQANRLTICEQRLQFLPTSADCQGRLMRLTQVEEMVRHLPTQLSVDAGHARVHARVDEISTGLGEVKGGIRRMETTLDLIHQCLLTGGLHDQH